MGWDNSTLFRKFKGNPSHEVREFLRSNPDRVRDFHLRAKYAISLDEWKIIFETQGRVCGNTGCGKDKPGSKSGWATDHCHVTGKVRGILCHGCNIALGGVKDKPRRLAGLILYLKNS